MLTTVHRRTRLRYARNHRNWTASQWRNVLFIDESRFCLFGNNARIRTWWHRREHFETNHVDLLERLVEDPLWYGGGISTNHQTDLVILQPPVFTAVRYINEVLCPCVISMRRRIGRDFILTQDNEIWHEIPQDSIRACINMQERLGEVIRRRGGNTRYWMPVTLVRSGIRQIGFGVRKYCGSDELWGP